MNIIKDNENYLYDNLDCLNLKYLNMDISNQPNQTIIKLFSIGAVSLALNYLINTKLLQKPKNTNQTQQKTHIINQALQKEK